MHSATSAGSSVKKSWASLLRTEGVSPSTKASNQLPTSAVVGFSIPAQDEAERSHNLPVSPGKANDLLRLLKDGPSGTTAPPRIRPRGLVNTGNMCFANAVLQVLVYCPPFYRLFVELGKYVANPQVNYDYSKSAPLVASTVQFLKEFEPKVESFANIDDTDGFDGIDSFLPTYVYVAMKEKKRFDSMGVSLMFYTT